MIRFVDLTSAYWTDPDETKPMCAFFSTVDNRFLENEFGTHVCSDIDDVRELGDGQLGERCMGLLPPNFFGTGAS